MLGRKFMKESSYKVGKYISSKLENNSYRMILNLKACVRYFSFFQPMITLKKLWKMLFISSKKLFLLSKYSDFCISLSSLFLLSAIARKDDRR